MRTAQRDEDRRNSLCMSTRSARYGTEIRNCRGTPDQERKVQDDRQSRRQDPQPRDYLEGIWTKAATDDYQYWTKLKEDFLQLGRPVPRPETKQTGYKILSRPFGRCRWFPRPHNLLMPQSRGWSVEEDNKGTQSRQTRYISEGMLSTGN